MAQTVCNTVRKPRIIELKDFNDLPEGYAQGIACLQLYNDKYHIDEPFSQLASKIQSIASVCFLKANVNRCTTNPHKWGGIIEHLYGPDYDPSLCLDMRLPKFLFFYEPMDKYCRASGGWLDRPRINGFRTSPDVVMQELETVIRHLLGGKLDAAQAVRSEQITNVETTTISSHKRKKKAKHTNK